MNNMSKVNFITKYHDQFSMIPLKGVSKVAAVTRWQKYSDEMSTFTIEELAENNYGIVTGRASKLLVLDVDNFEVFNSFLRRNGFSVPDTFAVKTGKGKHLYFTYPSDEKEYPCKRYGVFEFDIRGKGGYAVGPYSHHEESGRYYDVSVDVDIAEAPIWLMAYSLQINNGNDKPSIDNKIRNKEIVELIRNGVEVGQRSEAMYKVMGSLIANKFTDDQIFYVFNMYPIGEKYLEKPEHLRDAWLQVQIDKARGEFANDSQDPAESVSDSTIPEITCLSAREFRKKELKIEWLVEGLIEKGGHTLITGQSNVGKSMFTTFMALTLASAPAEGFLGYKIPKPITVAVIQCENPEEFAQKRINDMCKINPAFENGLDNLYVTYFDENLDNPIFKFSSDKLDEMISAIYEKSRPDLLIIDPYKCYSGVPENDNDKNSDVLRKLFYSLKRYNITSFIVHHQGRARDVEGMGMSRGASTITDSIFNNWTLTRDDKKDTGVEQLLIQSAKARNAIKFKDIYLEIVDGVFYKAVETPYDPKILTDLLIYAGGTIEKQIDFIDLIVDKVGTSRSRATQMIAEATVKGFIASDKHGVKNSTRYYLPVSDKDA